VRCFESPTTPDHDDYSQLLLIIEGGTPFSAREVAPPALSDWPAVSESKKRRRRLMKKDHMGMDPLLVSHKGELKGNLRSRVFK
jgi:hypothetical protein